MSIKAKPKALNSIRHAAHELIGHKIKHEEKYSFAYYKALISIYAEVEVFEISLP